MICPNCGKENADAATHCGGCGAALRAGADFGFLVGRMSEQQLARRLLDTRQRGGPSFRAVLRLNRKSYLILLAIYATALVVLGMMDQWIAFAFVAGILFARFLRDWQYTRTTRKVWPFNLKIIDWEKVEKLAQSDVSTAKEK